MYNYLKYILILAGVAIAPLYVPLHAAEQKSNTTPHVLGEKSSYTFVKLIGKGEKAEVFQALDSQGAVCAVKRLYSKKQMSPLYPSEYLETIFAADGSSVLAQREFSMSQQLNHPHILKIHDCFTRVDAEDGEIHTYLVSEFVQGATLAEAARGSISRQQAIQNGVDLLDALRHAFSRHLIHEDLYADNIMIDNQGRLKLIDIDAFEEWPTEEDDDEDASTVVEYASEIAYVLQDVLLCGAFSSEELYLLTETLFEKIQNHPHSDQKVSKGSEEMLMGLLGEMTMVLTHGESDAVQKNSNDLDDGHRDSIDNSAGNSTIGSGGSSTL